MQTIIKKANKEKIPTELYNNGHICPTYMLLSPGIEPSPCDQLGVIRVQ